MSDTNNNLDPDDPGTLRARFEESQGVLLRENAFLRAGVDLDSPLGRVFARGYDGELTPEAIRTGFAEIAPTPAVIAATDPIPAPVATPVVAVVAPTADETAALAAASALAQGVAPVDTPTQHPSRAAVEGYYADLKLGVTNKDAEARAFDTVFGAAAQGDQRVIIPNGRQGGS